jgi:hypothetical protein
MNKRSNETVGTPNEAMQSIVEHVVEAMLHRAFNPLRSDDVAGAEAARFVFRALREGVLIAPAGADEYAIGPPSMVDPCIVETVGVVHVPASDISEVVTAALQAMAPALADLVRHGLLGRAGFPTREMPRRRSARG